MKKKPGLNWLLMSIIFYILFFLTLDSLPKAQTIKPKFQHPQGDFVQINGVKLWYESEGVGEPLLLIAGGPGFAHNYFHPFFSALSNKFRVIYFDAFGCGKSDRAKSAKEYSLARDVENIEGLRKALNLEKINVLGHSYGGSVAQAYALKYPNSVKRLILANTIPSGKDLQTMVDGVNRQVQAQLPEVWDKIQQLRARGFRSSSKEHQEIYSVPPVLYDFYNPENFLKLPRFAAPEPNLLNPELWYAIAGEDADFQIGGELGRWDVRAQLNQLKMPILVFAGRFDRGLSPRLTLQYKTLIPHAQFVMFEKSGHLPFVEETEETMSVLRKFLDQ
jgi:proline iminopeptidase